MYLYELGLSLLLLGLYSISGLTLTFLVLMGVGLVLGEDAYRNTTYDDRDHYQDRHDSPTSIDDDVIPF